MNQMTQKCEHFFSRQNEIQNWAPYFVHSHLGRVVTLKLKLKVILSSWGKTATAENKLERDIIWSVKLILLRLGTWWHDEWFWGMRKWKWQNWNLRWNRTERMICWEENHWDYPAGTRHDLAGGCPGPLTDVSDQGNGPGVIASITLCICRFFLLIATCDQTLHM